MLKRLLMSLLLLTAVLNATTPTQENVTKLYVAMFDRAPDSAGLDWWINDSKLDLEGIAESFFEQEESQIKYPPSTTDEEFIRAVYENLFNRPIDAGGMVYWKKELESGKIPRSLFVLAVINGALGDDAKILENKTTVGLAFAEAGLNDAEDAECVLKCVTEDDATVKEGLEKVKAVLNSGVCNPACKTNPPTPPHPGPGQRPFITTWDTAGPNDVGSKVGNGYPAVGPSNPNEITIGTHAGYTYNYTVDWGDGTIDTGVTGDIIHTYGAVGSTVDSENGGTLHTVKISGVFPGICAFAGCNLAVGGVSAVGGSYNPNAGKLISVDQWGTIAWKTMRSAFMGCYNMELTALDTPVLLQVTDMSEMFANASIFNGDISRWNVSSVTNMNYMFAEAYTFNQDISGWNVSNVTNMRYMFAFAHAFNQDIGGWDVSNVTNMSNMFSWMSAFNQDISGWNVSKVTDMSHMFYNAFIFNQDISGWNVSSVTDHTDFCENWGGGTPPGGWDNECTVYTVL